MSAAVGPAAERLVAPSLRRRLMCLVYEGVVLFGVVMIGGYLYSALTQQRHALIGSSGLQAFLFLVLGIYFIWFWSHGGQTVAMKTWHVRLVHQDGLAVPQRIALVRYLLSWLWFLPALAFVHFAGLSGLGTITTATLVGMSLFAATSLLDGDGQFWHDRLCGTRLIDSRAAAAAAN